MLPSSFQHNQIAGWLANQPTVFFSRIKTAPAISQQFFSFTTNQH